MRVLILGVSGMLGHQLCRLLNSRMEVFGTVRADTRQYEPLNILPEKQLIGNMDITHLSVLKKNLELVKPDVVVNGIGIVKQRDEGKQAVPSIQVNALFPHQLADMCAERGIRVIQVSTDCVFSGFRGNY
jgi:dTDP-4-dehydrorhamnose reductase